MKIDCKLIRDAELDKIRNRIKELELKRKLKAIIIQVGDRPDSTKYVQNKIKTLESVGMKAEHKKFPKDISPAGLINYIMCCNASNSVDGIIVQLPLPYELKDYTDMILKLINPNKDIDCITPERESMVYSGESNILPCTVSGIMKIFEYENIDLKGKDILVIGRSRIVGKPLAITLINNGATVTVANSHTNNLDLLIKNNKIVISAVGKIDLLNPNNVDNTHTIIDVGINFDNNGKLVGDTNKRCYDIVKKYTPVPFGVGQLTTIEVASNLLKLWEENND
ncbi:MAG: bifunctional 5,10-methylenetetrahydrofolate dehydrogenase/5,10-methenyltetrahydrofolate cyclohydrolase [Paraclostridium sp.]